MKIAVSANGHDLNATLEPRFGRCRQFVIVETETMEYEFVENTNTDASGGAGIQTAQFLASQQIKAVITGNCGPNAFKTLEAAEISAYVGGTGTVKELVEQYKNGQLQAASQANVDGHFGDQRAVK